MYHNVSRDIFNAYNREIPSHDSLDDVNQSNVRALPSVRSLSCRGLCFSYGTPSSTTPFLE